MPWDKNRDELLGYFAERLLSVPEQQAVARWLKDDPVLGEEVRIQAEIAQLMAKENPPLVPQHVVANASNLVSETFGGRVWSLMARFTKDAGWLLKSNGIFADSLITDAGPLRGPAPKRAQSILIKKDFKAFGIQLEIERTQNFANRIVIYAQDIRTHDPINDLRITLLENDTELESHITYKGKIRFENVLDGQYVFAIAAPHHPLARITLEIFQE